MVRPEEDVRRLIVAAWPRLFRFACGLCGNRADGEDLAQSAVERALLAASRYRTGESMEAWLIHITRNLWRDGMRRRQVRGVVVSDEMVDVERPQAAQAEEHVMAMDALRAFAYLAPAQREVAAMILVEGLSYQEAASALGIPIGTVMSRLARARSALIERPNGHDPEIAPEGSRT